MARTRETNLLSPQSVVWGAVAIGFIVRVLLAVRMPSPFLFQDELNGPLIARWLVGSETRAIGPGGGLLHGIVLAPVAWLFPEPGSFHTAALIANAVVALPLAPLLYRIGTVVLRHSPYTSAAAAAAGSLTASTLAFSAMVLPEVLLTVVATATVLVMDRYLDHPTFARQLELVAILMLAALTHDRAVVLVVAAFLTILWARLTERVAQIDSTLPLIGLPLGYLVVRLVTASVHSSVLVEGGPTTSVVDVLLYPVNSPQTAAKVALGGAFYLVAATAGLAAIGVVGIAAGLRPQQTGRAVTVYVALSVLGTATLSTMFVTGVATNSPFRVDTFMYGRYLEFLLPVVIIYIVQVWESLPAKTLALLGAAGITAAAGFVARSSYDEAFWVGPNAQSNASGLHWIKPFDNVLNIGSVWVYPFAAVLAILIITLTFRVEQTALFTVAGLSTAAGILFVVNWAQLTQTQPELTRFLPNSDDRLVVLPIDQIGSQRAQLITFWAAPTTVRHTFGLPPQDATELVLPADAPEPSGAVFIATDERLDLTLWSLTPLR